MYFCVLPTFLAVLCELCEIDHNNVSVRMIDVGGTGRPGRHRCSVFASCDNTNTWLCVATGLRVPAQTSPVRLTSTPHTGHISGNISIVQDKASATVSVVPSVSDCDRDSFEMNMKLAES